MNEQLLSDLEQIGLALFTLVREQSRLLSLEVELAKQSLLPFCISLALCFFMALSLYFGIVIAMGYGLYCLTDSIPIALSITLLINLSLLLLTMYCAMAYRKNMNFTHTKRNLNSLIKDKS